MNLVVMKFGGVSLESSHAIQRVCALIKQKRQECAHIIVVVSAMGAMTDDLLQFARTFNPQPPKREEDMLVSAGERISASILSIALAAHGIDGVSLTGSQAGVITSHHHSCAWIQSVKPVRIPPLLEQGRVVVVAGFQGVSEKKDVTTLGRGGSDTTAVALGVALKASKVEFYKDVGGVYTEDPNLVPEAFILPHLTYDEALAIYGRARCSVIHPRALVLAKSNALPLHVLSFQKENLAKNPKGSWIVEDGQKRPLEAIYEDGILCQY